MSSNTFTGPNAGADSRRFRGARDGTPSHRFPTRSARWSATSRSPSPNFPEDDVLDDLDLESPFDLLGLFQGVGLAHASATAATGAMPNRIWLYRRPILDYWAEHEETLDAIVTHVLIHEIGHHFGLSDDDMEAIEAAAE